MNPSSSRFPIFIGGAWPTSIWRLGGDLILMKSHYSIFCYLWKMLIMSNKSSLMMWTYNLWLIKGSLLEGKNTVPAHKVIGWLINPCCGDNYKDMMETWWRLQFFSPLDYISNTPLKLENWCYTCNRNNWKSLPLSFFFLFLRSNRTS